jgi:hypothetical protein
MIYFLHRKNKTKTQWNENSKIKINFLVCLLLRDFNSIYMLMEREFNNNYYRCRKNKDTEIALSCPLMNLSKCDARFMLLFFSVTQSTSLFSFLLKLYTSRPSPQLTIMRCQISYNENGIQSFSNHMKFIRPHFISRCAVTIKYYFFVFFERFLYTNYRSAQAHESW